MPPILWVFLGLAAFAAIGFVLRLNTRGAIRARLDEDDAEDALPAASTGDDYALGPLARRLFRAGLRGPGAGGRFVAQAVLAAAAGGAVGYALLRSGLVERLAEVFALVPGGVADLLVPIAWAAPWLIGLEVAVLPWYLVHLRRQRRVRDVERDLPLLLDLLAALADAGLSFDAAVERVLPAMPAGRPLVEELRGYRTELLAGRRRAAALRRLAWRIDLPSISVFVSALIHADQVGAGMTAVLRRQADDLRERRREQALAHALAVQVRMILPMIVCFLPGIFVISLGPIFLRFFEMAEGMFGGYGR